MVSIRILTPLQKWRDLFQKHIPEDRNKATPTEEDLHASGKTSSA